MESAYFRQDEVEIKGLNQLGVRHADNLRMVDFSEPVITSAI